jgi:hypothetical protein
MKCATKDRNLKPCRGNATTGRFCVLHGYMIDYTDTMVEEAKPCGTCRKTHYMGDYTTCEPCRKRGIENRGKKKEEIVKCAKEGCSFKKSEENTYCGKHQLYVFMNETEELGLKMCKNAVRGCRTQLAKEARSACDDCLEKEREKDHKRRGGTIKETVSEKQCACCCKMYSKEMFQGLHGETHTCQTCRDANKRADEKRDKEHTNELARLNSLKPERKVVKKAWKESNYEKVAMYCIQHRKKLIEEDVDKYHADNAETMKKWRDANPEKVQEINEKSKNNIYKYYQVYKNSAILKQLIFEITKDEYLIIVKSPCTYCGIIQEKGFNGIDRIDSTVGYVNDNCVSCCAMCNYMKGCLDKDIFTQRVEHIATYNKFVEGKLYPASFKDYNPYYESYILRAEKKRFIFDISEELFDTITSCPCYTCGKLSTKEHQNGLDRIDSSIGYIKNNVYSCCGNCNYMKNNYSYKIFIDKCVLICNKLNKKTLTIEDTPIQNEVVEIKNEVVVPEQKVKEMRTIVKGNKLSSDDITELARLRKQKSRADLKAKYGDEEYNKRHAKQIADNRKKKNEKSE